jgi:hypothetical protein
VVLLTAHQPRRVEAKLSICYLSPYLQSFGGWKSCIAQGGGCLPGMHFHRVCLTGIGQRKVGLQWRLDSTMDDIHQTQSKLYSSIVWSYKCVLTNLSSRKKISTWVFASNSIHMKWVTLSSSNETHNLLICRIIGFCHYISFCWFIFTHLIFYLKNAT